MDFILIAGPCVIESKSMIYREAERIKEIVDSIPYAIDFYFKASFDKANRTSIDSFRGPGIEKGMDILREVKREYNVRVVTDIHEPYQAGLVSEVVDMIQIPAFLCRQTDLLTAAAKTGKRINIKKGQYLAPWDMENVIKKVVNTGNNDIILCERGTCFGYNRLVVDMTGIHEMKKYGFPVIFDGTHSVQLPGGNGNTTSGNREYVECLSKAALAAGADGLFWEAHENPDKALSDGPNMIRLDNMRELIEKCMEIWKISSKPNLTEKELIL